MWPTVACLQQQQNLKNISVMKFIFIKIEDLHLSNLHEMNIFTGVPIFLNWSFEHHFNLSSRTLSE